MSIIMIESFPELLKATTGKRARLPIPIKRKRRKRKAKKKVVSFVVSVSRK